MGSMLLLGIKNEIMIKQLGIRIPFLRLLNTFSIFPNYLLTMQKIQIKQKKKKDYHFNKDSFSIGKYIIKLSGISKPFPCGKDQNQEGYSPVILPILNLTKK